MNEVVYAVGGQGALIPSTVEAYDPSTKTCTTEASTPTPQTGQVVVAVNSQRLGTFIWKRTNLEG